MNTHWIGFLSLRPGPDSLVKRLAGCRERTRSPLTPGWPPRLFQVTSGTQLTSFILPLERFFPGQSVQLTDYEYQDGLGNKSQFAAPQTMLDGTTFPSLVPGTFEDFETTARIRGASRLRA